VRENITQECTTRITRPRVQRLLYTTSQHKTDHTKWHGTTGCVGRS